MDYKTAVQEFDSLSDDDSKTKEVYAHFGLTIFLCQLIEQQAINMIAILRQVKGKIISHQEVNVLWNEYDYGTKTFGNLINEIKQLYELTEKDKIELKEILRLRNYFAHDYFRFNNELFYSDSGKKRMIRDFIEFKDRVRTLDGKLSQYTLQYTEKVGMTDEAIKKLVHEMTEEWEKKEIDDNHSTFKKSGIKSS
jgi:F0F1-type ATP synthase beta subunit